MPHSTMRVIVAVETREMLFWNMDVNITCRLMFFMLSGPMLAIPCIVCGACLVSLAKLLYVDQHLQ